MVGFQDLYVHIRVCVCVHTYIHIYIHTYILVYVILLFLLSWARPDVTGPQAPQLDLYRFERP